MIVLGWWGIRQVSQPPEDVVHNLPAKVIGTAPSDGPSERGFLQRSAPVRIVIPKIKLRAFVDPTDIDHSGQIVVPPYEQAHRAAWYKGGVSPGERGPAVFVGHADSKTAVAVFFYTRNLRPGDLVSVEREDKRVAVFTVDSLEQVSKHDFPSARVYGMTNQSEIRLVTCAGRFDVKQQSYADNIIVFGHLTDLT